MSNIGSSTERLFRLIHERRYLGVPNLVSHENPDIHAIESETGLQPLQLLCRDSQQKRVVESAKVLLERGADPNVRDEEGNTPLLLALQHGQELPLVLLQNRQTQADVFNHEGSTTLSYAVKLPPDYSSIDLLETILKKIPPHRRIAFINRKNNKGNTPLMEASLHNFFWLEKVRWLIQHGSRVNMRNAERVTALMNAAGAGAEETVQMLVANGAKVNLRDSSGKSALMHAAKHPEENTIRLFLQHGAKFNFRDTNKRTFWMDAARGLKEPLLFEILHRLYFVNHQDVNGRTALMEAEAAPNRVFAEQLIQCGANPLIADLTGRIPLMEAVQRPDSEHALEHIRLLISRSYGEQLNWRAKDGSTPLMEAARANALGIMKIIQSEGADIMALDYSGDSALIYAIRGGAYRVIDYLFEQHVPTETKQILDVISEMKEKAMSTRKGSDISNYTRAVNALKRHQGFENLHLVHIREQ